MDRIGTYAKKDSGTPYYRGYIVVYHGNKRLWSEECKMSRLYRQDAIRDAERLRDDLLGTDEM